MMPATVTPDTTRCCDNAMFVPVSELTRYLLTRSAPISARLEGTAQLARRDGGIWLHFLWCCVEQRIALPAEIAVDFRLCKDACDGLVAAGGQQRQPVEHAGDLAAIDD